MAKKQKQKQPKTKQVSENTRRFFLTGEFSGTKEIYIIVLLAAMSAVALLAYILPMMSEGGVLGFPFDDSWIAHTYARNLVGEGAYSYFANRMVASGSTSPLYVVILAIGYLFTGSEYTIGFITGYVSLVLCTVYLFKLGRCIFKGEDWLALLVSVLFLCIPRVHSSALAGMSTLLYTAFILMSAYYYFSRKSILFFLFAGLALWLRPDALVFMLAAVLHMIYNHIVATKEAADTSGEQGQAVTAKDTRTGSYIYLALLGLYFGFNFWLSGLPFPSSVHAKLAYYGALETSTFWQSLGVFFTEGGLAVLFPFAILGLVLIIPKFVRRLKAAILMSAAYLVGTILAFWLIHPHLVDGGRYLIPALPFFVLVSVWGMRNIVVQIIGGIRLPQFENAGKMFVLVVGAAAIIVGISGFEDIRQAHRQSVIFAHNRYVEAGKWIAQNVSKRQEVATHLPGAIGYYGNRRIIDMRGVVSPEMIPYIGDLVVLHRELNERGVDYIVTRRDEFEVVNVNPRFTSDPMKPGIVEAMPYIAGRTHITAQRATALNAAAETYLRQQRLPEAIRLLQESYAADPLSSRTALFAGYAFLNAGDTAQAKEFFLYATDLHPQYDLALEPLGRIYLAQDSLSLAAMYANRAYEINKESTQVRRTMERAVLANQQDSLVRTGWQLPITGP
ncbi:MAG: hypothetical protein CL946_03705 [Ectothiorhodospiraceae bacterium]|nr:hypothetical protein [Ectothiorhodospiraceae bacterium]